MTKASLIKENIELGLAYSFRGVVHYHQGGKHGSMQVDMVLEKKLRVLDLDPQATGDCVTGCSLSIGDLKACPNVMCFLQQRPHLLQ